MTWDFGDGSDTIQCKLRNCMEVQHMYALPSTNQNKGVYTVSVTLEFEKQDPVTVTMEMKIN